MKSARSFNDTHGRSRPPMASGKYRTLRLIRSVLPFQKKLKIRLFITNNTFGEIGTIVPTYQSFYNANDEIALTLPLYDK